MREVLVSDCFLGGKWNLLVGRCRFFFLEAALVPCLFPDLVFVQRLISMGSWLICQQVPWKVEVVFVPDTLAVCFEVSYLRFCSGIKWVSFVDKNDEKVALLSDEQEGCGGHSP